MRIPTVSVVILLGAVSCVGSQRTVAPAAPGRAAATGARIAIVIAGPHARQGSAIQLGSIDGKSHAWVADADDERIHVVDMENLAEASSIDVGGVPSEMVMLSDGSILAAVRSTNEIVRIGAGAVRARIPVAVEPISLALAPDETTLFVASGWSHTVTVVDVPSFTRVHTFDVAREPRKIAIEGWYAWVSHATGSKLERIDVNNWRTATFDIGGWRESFGMGAVGQSEATAVQGFALAFSGAVRPTLYAPRVLARTDRGGFWEEEGGEDSSDSYGGGDAFQPEALDVAKIDPDTGQVEIESQVLRAGFEDTRCSLPRAAVASGDRLFVACAGTDVVVELDGGFPAPHHAELRRTKVPPGPMALALDDGRKTLVVWSQFSRQISLVPLDKTVAESTALPAVTFAAVPRDPVLVRGRMLFHVSNDERISTDQRACASCHPDGREDGLVWQTNEGPRQTPMLAGRLEGTAPYGWRGMSPTVEHHLQTKSLKRLGGKGLPPGDLAALLAYVRSIPVPADRFEIAPGELERGEAIFNSTKTQCADCHGSDGRTPDGLDHNVRSWAPGDVRGVFDTPSLRGLAHTAPYFHDGRYASLEKLLAGVDGTMGHTKHLTKDELHALESYLRTR